MYNTCVVELYWELLNHSFMNNSMYLSIYLNMSTWTCLINSIWLYPMWNSLEFKCWWDFEINYRAWLFNINRICKNLKTIWLLCLILQNVYRRLLPWLTGWTPERIRVKTSINLPAEDMLKRFVVKDPATISWYLPLDNHTRGQKPDLYVLWCWGQLEWADQGDAGADPVSLGP